jgi:hypothetical protein
MVYGLVTRLFVTLTSFYALVSSHKVSISIERLENVSEIVTTESGVSTYVLHSATVCARITLEVVRYGNASRAQCAR